MSRWTRMGGSPLSRMVTDPQPGYDKNVKRLQAKVEKLNERLTDAQEFHDELLAIINDYANQIDRMKKENEGQT